jgi:hypothetical protein
MAIIPGRTDIRNPRREASERVPALGEVEMDSRRSDVLTISILSVSIALLTLACLGANPGANEILRWEVDDYVLVSETDTGWKGVGGRKTKERIFAEPGATTDDWTITLHVTEWPIAIILGGEVQWNAPSMLGAVQRRLSDEGCDDPWIVLQSTADIGDWYAWWTSFRIRNTTLTVSDRNALISKLEQAQIGD